MDDYDVEDIFQKNNSKRKKQSGPKGKRGERNLRDLLSKRFKGQIFSRVVGSGNRWAQAALTEASQKVLTGDIVVPDTFRFSIECKHGYPAIDLHKILGSNSAKLDEFLDQAAKDARRIKKEALLFWKKDHFPWVIFIKKKNMKAPAYYYSYRNWYIISLETLFGLPDSFFFDQSS
jgi:hypothetical protein